MDIAKAKQQIKHAMTAYFSKDEFGNYRIPVEKQRPVFLIGPPGIGKTAIMEQIASELGVGLVSYSMTHHTRQSALGLPYITTQEYEGQEFQVSEYTMSEIISSVYRLMKTTGVKEGILFLDEINCVSETLAPCMLQFLQYKMFGQHKVPDGWILVTAGNPPEYNKSVRDFDIVTWDRLKRIDVEPNYEIWKKYALQKGVHPAIMTYLSARTKDFYKIESSIDGKHFVTARGWDDLSEMIFLFEEHNIPVDESLICQYIQDKKITKDFSIYYDLFHKYQSDYQIPAILNGDIKEHIILRAQNAALDERLAILGLLFDAVASECKKICETETMLESLVPILRKMQGMQNIVPLLDEAINEQQLLLENGKKASKLSQRKQTILHRIINTLNDFRKKLICLQGTEASDSYIILKEEYTKLVDTFKKDTQTVSSQMDHAFIFCEKAFDEENEILLFVTELTSHYDCARFIGHYGNDKYYLHNKELQFAERQQEIEQRIQTLDLL